MYIDNKKKNVCALGIITTVIFYFTNLLNCIIKIVTQYHVFLVLVLYLPETIMQNMKLFGTLSCLSSAICKNMSPKSNYFK